MPRGKGEADMAGERLTIISADCHAGPERMADYRPYLEAAFHADFHSYCARIDAYEAQIGSGLTAGGATSTGEDGTSSPGLYL